MRRFALALLASTALASTASAADLAHKAPPVVAPVYAYSWTGFYVGGHLGYGWGETQWYDDEGYSPMTSEADGFLGGLQLGFDYQINSIVIGVQGDVSWTDASVTSSFLEYDAYDVYDHTHRDRTSWLASLTARLGVAAANTLWYVKGGAAWASLDHDHSFTFDDEIWAADASKTRSGWTVGVGAEYAFTPNWTLFAEYDYYDFGKDAVALDFGGKQVPVFDVESTVNVVKVGVNYRFGGPAPAAVAARY